MKGTTNDLPNTHRRALRVPLGFLALPAWAMEYQLEVTNVDFLHPLLLHGKATPWWHQNEPLGRLEARLDAQQFSHPAVLPGAKCNLLEDPKYGGTVPTRVSLAPGHREAGLDHLCLGREAGGTPWSSM